jgi:hypothetical protein
MLIDLVYLVWPEATELAAFTKGVSRTSAKISPRPTVTSRLTFIFLTDSCGWKFKYGSFIGRYGGFDINCCLQATALIEYRNQRRDSLCPTDSSESRIFDAAATEPPSTSRLRVNCPVRRTDRCLSSSHRRTVYLVITGSFMAVIDACPLHC